MPVIGTFSPTKDGYAGELRTLMLRGRVRLIANDHKSLDGAPDFRVYLGAAEIGAAWRKTKQGSAESTLRVRLDDPTWPQPIWAILYEATEDGIIRLIWRRPQSPRGAVANAGKDDSREARSFSP